MVDGGFEQPRLPSGTGYKLYSQAAVPGWRTDDPNGAIELWNGKRMGVAAAEGRQFTEINATGASSSVFQDIRTVPGSLLTWSMTVRASNSTPGVPDAATTQVQFGPAPRSSQGGTQDPSDTFTYRNTADDGQWKTLYGYYQVPSDQTWTRLSLASVAQSTAVSNGDLVDKVIVTGMRC